MPSGFSGSFSPTTLAFSNGGGGGNSTRSTILTLSVASSVATGSYSFTVRATAVGDAADYADATVTVSVGGQQPQTIAFAQPADMRYGDEAVVLSPTSTSGLPVSLAIVSGPANLSGNSLTVTGVGTVTVRASQAGNASYSVAPNVDRSFTVAKALQTITFPAVGNLSYGQGPVSLSATATSGLAVDFSVVSGPASVSGSTLTITGAGDVVVRGTQAGNSNYLSASSVDQTISVAKASQSITFSPIDTSRFGSGPLTLSATATSGLPVEFSVVSGSATVSGSTLSATAPGTVVVRASQSGNDNFSAAPDSDQSLLVLRSSQSIALSAPPTIDVLAGTLSISASATSGLPVELSVSTGPGWMEGSVLHVTGAGDIVVVARQSGNGTFEAATPQSATVRALKRTQTIAFDCLTRELEADQTVSLSATASSGLPVKFQVLSGPGFVTGNSLTVTGEGTVVVSATQRGNAFYAAAAPVIRATSVINRPLYGESDFYVARSGELLNIEANGILVNDASGAYGLPVLVAPTANGYIELATDGSFVYRSRRGFVGLDTFTYRLTTLNKISGIITVTIEVRE